MADSTPSVQLIDSLMDASVYPHSVTRVELIETHISWVLLTGNYVYKIKKPVDFGFLDFSTLQRRHYFCEQELRLNRRFASAIYLEVVAITGSVNRPEINGDDEVIEYALKMREFPQSSLFTQCADRAEISPSILEQLAYKLASFHRQAINTIPASGVPGKMGDIESITQDTRENFSQTQYLLDYSPGSALVRLRQWTDQQLELLTPIFAARKAAGFICECHGDLHLGNIAIIDEQVTFFDCLEFNERLRWIDTFCELSFLLMDLDHISHRDWANSVLNLYVQYSGDYQGLQLLQFYKVYRAMVRTKVSALRLTQTGLPIQQRQEIKADCDAYIQLAEQYIQHRTPFLAITHGLSGSGKSHVSKRIAQHCDAVCLRSDVERKRLHGFSPLESTQSALGAGIYSVAATDKTFAHLRSLAEQILSYGVNVIVDATFLSGEKRNLFKTLADDCELPFIIIDCQASESTLIERLIKRNQSHSDASEADVNVMRRQRENQDPFDEWEQPHVFVVDTQKALTVEKFDEFCYRQADD